MPAYLKLEMNKANEFVKFIGLTYARLIRDIARFIQKTKTKKLQFDSELDLNSIFSWIDLSFEFSCFGLVFFKKKSSQFKKIRVIFELFFELNQTKNRTRNKQKLDFLRWQLLILWLGSIMVQRWFETVVTTSSGVWTVPSGVMAVSNGNMGMLNISTGLLNVSENIINSGGRWATPTNECGRAMDVSNGKSAMLNVGAVAWWFVLNRGFIHKRK